MLKWERGNERKGEKKKNSNNKGVIIIMINHGILVEEESEVIKGAKDSERWWDNLEVPVGLGDYWAPGTRASEVKT